jgi:hypothetical protein
VEIQPRGVALHQNSNSLASRARQRPGLCPAVAHLVTSGTLNMSNSIECYARLNEKIMPIDRGEVYEEPLAAALEEAGLGSVPGGGTMQEKTGEIKYAGLDVTLLDRDRGIPFVCQFLERCGAPKGSVLEIGKERFPFGKAEAVAIYFDGVNLAPEVYRDSDINLVWAELEKRISPKGKIRGYWQGPTETALYLYGESASNMRKQIADFLDSYPLCKGAREVTFAPPAKA